MCDGCSGVRDLSGVIGSDRQGLVQDFQQRSPEPCRIKPGAAQYWLAMIHIRQADLRQAWYCQVFHIELAIMRMPRTQGVQALMVCVEA